MSINDTAVETKGFEFNSKNMVKLDTYINKLKSTLPVSNLKIKLVKVGSVFEGMLWCQAYGMPLGTYNRHISLAHLIESLFKKINKECRRAMKISWKATEKKTEHQTLMNENKYELVG